MPGSNATPSRNRRAVILAALATATALALLVALAVGARTIAPSEVLAAILGRSDSADATVITSQRVPRSLLALVAGAALGVAGALMQGHTRNPLAEPGLFGVNAGASFAVALTTYTLGLQSPFVIAAVALLGAVLVSTVVFVLGLGSLRSGGLVMLAILGTTISALLSALTSALLLLDRQTLDVQRFWEVGSVANRDLGLVPVLLPVMVLGFALALANAFSLNALALGNDVAQGLGTPVRRSRIVGIAATAMLAGSATALCGPIAFVGLAAPHIARSLSGHDYRWLLPYAGLVGAAVLVLADTVGRVIAPPGEVQAGIVVVALGAPMLLAITRRRRLVAL